MVRTTSQSRRFLREQGSFEKKSKSFLLKWLSSTERAFTKYLLEAKLNTWDGKTASYLGLRFVRESNISSAYRCKYNPEVIQVREKLRPC